MRVRSCGRLAVVSALFLAALSCKQGIGNNDMSGQGSELMTAEGTRLKDDPTYGEWAFENKNQKVVDNMLDDLNLTGGGDDFELVEGDIAVNKKTGLNLGSAEANVWPNATLIYAFDPSYPAAERQEVLKAMQIWTQETGVKFRERRNETAYASIVRKEDGCWSNIGYTGQLQYINLGPSCVLLGTKIHELGHSLGLNHEQSRRDRDNHITINIKNVDSTALDNFSVGSIDVGPYDFDSVMHYGKYAFSANGQPTIEPRGGQRIGQRQGPSVYDVLAISQMYRTTGAGGSGMVVIPGSNSGVDITDPNAISTSAPELQNRNTLAAVPAAPPLPAPTTSVATGCPGFGGYDWLEKYAKDSAGKCREAAKYCTCWRTTANTCGLYLPNGTTNVAGANFTGNETNCKESCGQVATNGATYMRNNCSQQLVVINAEGLLEIYRYGANGRDAIPESENL